MAAANVLNFSTLLASACTSQFKMLSPYAMTANRKFQMDFEDKEYRPGTFINARIANRGTAQEGAIRTPTAVLERFVPLKVQEMLGSAWQFGSVETSLKLTEQVKTYMQQYVGDNVDTCSSFIESKIANAGLTQVNNFTGNPSSSFSSWGAVDLVNAQMAKLNIPKGQGACMVLDDFDASALKAANQNSFNDKLNEDITWDSQLGRLARFQLYTSSVNPIHIPGSGVGTPLTQGVPAEGSTSITIDGFTPNAVAVLREGDLITFGTLGNLDAVQSIQKSAQVPTGMLASFVVIGGNRIEPPSLTPNVYDADGAGAVTITINAEDNQGFISTTQNKLIDHLPADNTPVNILSAGIPYKNGYAYVPDGLLFAAPPLKEVPANMCGVAKDEINKMSMRFVRQYDPANDIDFARLDMLYAFTWLGGYSIRIVSKA